MIEINNLQFYYDRNIETKINFPNIRIKQKEHIFIEGPSGCGKTTLLNLITGILTPTNGTISIFNTDIHQLNTFKRDQFRADNFGIIFQLFNLIPYLNIIDNIKLACEFSKQKKINITESGQTIQQAAKNLCKKLDIDQALFDKNINQLSIGQQQRIAIARALIGNPKIIIADEPTSALDNNRTNQFMKLLIDECNLSGATLIFVSHDLSLKTYFNTSINLIEQSVTKEIHNVIN